MIGVEQRRVGWAFAAALVGVSALDVVAAIWLREGRRRGARLALATTPLTLALGAAFALPFLLAVAPLRAILVMAGFAASDKPPLGRSREMTLPNVE